MTRRMSCSLTIDAVRERRKTVTRRHVDTWRTLAAGDHLVLVEKAMGLPKGARQVVLADVEIVDVRVEPLTALWLEPDEPGSGVWAEGLGDEMSGNRFAYWWAESHGYRNCRSPEDLAPILVRRIAWRYLDDQGDT
jgi:hypothetical protein